MPTRLGLRVLTASVILFGLNEIARAEPPTPIPKPVRTDLYGDPLPQGAIARMGTLRFRNDRPITCVAFAPDGKTLVTASGIRTVRLWETASGKELRRFEEDGC